MRLVGCLLLTSLGASVLAAPRQARAQPTASARSQARESFHAGVEAYTHGEFATALAAFQNAYRLAPAPAVRVNMANCYVQLHQPVEALDDFEQFLVESPGAPARQRHEVEQQIDELRQQVAEVRVRVSPDSATDLIVSVDGHPAATRGTLRMAPGHHTLEASADGFQPARTDVDVTAGQRSDLPLLLRPRASTVTVATPGTTASLTPGLATTPEGPATPAPPPLDAPPAAPARRGWPQGVFIAGAVATGVGVVGTVVFGALALGANGAFQDDVRHVQQGDDGASWTVQGHDDAARARTMAAVADGFLGFSVVAAGFSVLALTQTRWGHEAVVAPSVSAHGGGVQFGARF